MSSLRRSSRIAECDAARRAVAVRGNTKHLMKSIYGLRTLNEDSSLVLEELIDMLRPIQAAAPASAQEPFMDALRLLHAALACAEEYNDAKGTNGAVSDYKYTRLSRLVRNHTFAAYQLIVANIREQ